MNNETENVGSEFLMLPTKFQGHQPFVSGQEVSTKRVSHHLNVTLNDLEVWESYFHVLSTTVDNVYKRKKETFTLIKEY